MPERHEIPDLKDIIDNADAELLRAFLRKHATRNVALALKLRAHLVEGIDSRKGVNKYSQVIGLLVHHNVQGTIHLTKRSLQILRDICEHFIKLLTRHLQEGELREAWDAAYAIISHLHMLMDKYQGPDQKLITLLSDSYACVLELFQLNPAPELKQSIFDALKAIAYKNHHLIYEVNHNIIMCLIRSASDIDERKEVANLVIEKIRNTTDHEETQHRLWQALLLKIPFVDVDITTLIDSTDVFHVAYLLHASQDMVGLSRLLTVFDLPGELSVAQQKQWLKWKFDEALRNGSPADIQDTGWNLLTLDEDLSVYLRMREAVGANFTSDRISSASITNDFKCEIYAYEKAWDELALCLRKSASLPLLIRYCKNILSHITQPEDLIYEVVAAYAEHHVGSAAIEQVALLLETIRALRHEDIFVSIAKRLKADFPGRFDAMKLRKQKKSRRRMNDY